MPTPDLAPHRWLAIVGIGEDGVDGLTPAARRLIEGAEVVFGGKRHLALAAPLIRGAVRRWPSPFDRAVEDVLAHRGRPVCVLASGDPFHYGVGPLLARAVPADEIVAVPAPSAFSLAAARLGWPLADTALLSLHGRSLDLIRPHLHPGARILALTSDGDAPAALARLIADAGFGPSRMTVLEALGGPRERIRTTAARRLRPHRHRCRSTSSRSRSLPDPARASSPLTSGLPDALFEHDGQITKREVRAVTLSALAPRRGELLWDIGAGSGSVGIEWMLADRSLRAVAIEADPSAPRASPGTPRPSACPASPSSRVARPAALAGLDAARRDLRRLRGGRRGDRRCRHRRAPPRRTPGRQRGDARKRGGAASPAMRRSAATCSASRIARAEPLGGVTGWRPAMPITQWTWIKP